MKITAKATTTSASSAPTLPRSAPPSHAANTSLIDLDNVTVRYSAETVLHNVSLCVHRGEFIGLIGPNGAGKTTLLKTILGLTAPSKGTVRRASAAVGYIPQRGALYNGIVPMSALEVVRLGAPSTAAAMQALQNVGLKFQARKPFTQLSGGQQQRVIIAKALAGGAELLILDEPATGIDERAQAEFYALLHQLQQAGITIIMVSHEVETVLKLVTRVICLSRSIIYDGPPEHFEADKYLPQAYTKQHVQLHHHHGGAHA